MKARKGPPKDYQEIRAKVEQASKLMAGGLSESRAAKKVGLPRSSLQHYLKHGIPKPALPKPEVCQDD
ncbi:MAG TPA: helix-turn-helix domain-containing protein, partial [Methanothrix sp.]|nr:helix-turn-helix domain-containing protein [Methanothrix sp.]